MTAELLRVYFDRCLRCGHPYRVGEMGSGRWTPCDDSCTHVGPIRYRFADEAWCDFGTLAHNGWRDEKATSLTGDVEAEWRILTVHHLNGVKHDCRWWNLVSLCQRCHLTIQGKVRMGRPWVREHSDWFKPFVAAYYAESLLGEELTREQVDGRLEELLNLQPHTPRML